MPKPKKVSLKAIYNDAVELPRQMRQQILQALSLRTGQSFYDIINGVRPLSEAEKNAIADILGRKVDEIIWPTVKVSVE